MTVTKSARLAQRLRRAQRAIILTGTQSWDPQPHQVAPSEWRSDPNVFGWNLKMGRWSGKTHAATRAVVDHVQGPACFADVAGEPPHRVAIVAPTLDDARRSVVNGPTGLLLHWQNSVTTPGGRSTRTSSSFTEIRWRNGAEAILVHGNTAEGVERLRAGGNRCFTMIEEAAAIGFLEEIMEQVDTACRINGGKVVVASTPKYTTAYLNLLNRPDFIVSTATTFDNARAMATEEGRAVIERLRRRYEGTAFGAQELYADLVADNPKAIWSTDLIGRYRLPTDFALPWPADAMYISTDPGGSAKTTGIAAVAQMHGCPCGFNTPQPHAIVAQDLTIDRGERMARVVDGYRHWQADRVLYETNYEGEEVAVELRSFDPSIQLIGIRAVKAKGLRARAARGAYVAGRVHHLGVLPELEMEMVQWVPGEGESPHRIDAVGQGIARALDLSYVGSDPRWLIVRRYAEEPA